MEKDDLRIVFMGTPEFAVPSLDAIFNSGYHVTGVITAPDKASGRGRKIRYSPIKEYALANGIPLLQPERLKDEQFIEKLHQLNANLQVVVAFRMLPEIVWNMPSLGTFNLHASLLPQYRGAAPIHHAIINGEKETGLTTFFLDENIDTGKIIDQIKMDIGPEESTGQLHDRMMKIGADLVIKTIEKIQSGTVAPRMQKDIMKGGVELKAAPKIDKSFCAIDWNRPAEALHNFIRGLSPFPGAYSFLHPGSGKSYQVKILKAQIADDFHQQKGPGHLFTDQKTFLIAKTKDRAIRIIELQMEGKRKMPVEDFLRGFSIESGSYFGSTA